MAHKSRRSTVELKSAAELDIMRRAGALLREIREQIGTRVRPGITTRQLDQIAKRMMDKRGVIPAFLGYQGFSGTLCTSVNEEIVHGIPGDRILEEGDIISVDMGLILEGYYSDTAKTFPVGEIDAESQRLIDVTAKSLEIAIPFLTPGARMGDMSSAVQEYVEGEGFSVVREYAGHGIGKELHEDPRVPNHGTAGRGLRWQPGMVVAVEPMVNAGVCETRVLDDGWTVVTEDGKRSAHSEHTIAITEDGPEVLT